MANILAIESSCDETACAIISDGKEICSNVVSTQMKLHEKFGGVVPEVASRKHLDHIDVVILQAVQEANLPFEEIDAIAVTYGPGLVGSLLVGLSAGKALAYTLNKPLIGVHHIEGHIYANFLSHHEIKFPAICLVVSGGHTNIILIKDHGVYKNIGRTKDDAAGEAFDKIARALGLGYPGGPVIDKLSQKGNSDAIQFPRAKLDSPYDFSFSGLKSSVLNFLNKEKMKGNSIVKEDVAASFQKAVVDVLINNVINAALEYNIESILLAGGVAANNELRHSLRVKAGENNIAVYLPDIKYCTDNAAMIGTAAYYKWINQQFSSLDLNAIPYLPFDNYINHN